MTAFIARSDNRQQFESIAQIPDPVVREAFQAVDRGVFVGDIYQPLPPAQALNTFRAVPRGTPLWKERVREDSLSLPTSIAGTAGNQRILNASTAPLTLAQLVMLSGVTHGSRVLHIGTGTGYFDAVLSKIAGPHNVTSVDINPENIATAHSNLTKLQESGVLEELPTLTERDGLAAQDQPEQYDAIIATTSPREIPPTWVEQLDTGGRIVTELRGPVTGRVIALTRNQEGEAVGSFTSLTGNIMPAQSSASSKVDPLNPPQKHPGTLLSEQQLLESDDFLLFLQLHRADLEIIHPVTPRERQSNKPLRIQEASGSYADIWAFGAKEDGVYRVEQGGSEAVWEIAEEAFTRWNSLGRPDAEQLGLSVTPEGTSVWVKAPEHTIPTSFPKRNPTQHPSWSITPGYPPFPPTPYERAQTAQPQTETAEENPNPHYGRTYKNLTGETPQPWKLPPQPLGKRGFSIRP